MAENKLYTSAVRGEGETAYVIPSNAVGIPVFSTEEKAERDFRMFAAGKKSTSLDHAVIDISNLHEAVISRVFGEGVRAGN